MLTVLTAAAKLVSPHIQESLSLFSPEPTAPSRPKVEHHQNLSPIMKNFIRVKDIVVCCLRVVVLQLADGFDVTAKIAWTYAVKGFLTWGAVSSDQQGTELFDRALLYWAVALMYFFSNLTPFLQRWRMRLEFDAACDEQAREKSDEKTNVASQGLAVGLAAGLAAGLAVGLLVAAKLADGATGLFIGLTAGFVAGLAAGLGAGLKWRLLCIQYLLLLEATFGWVTGCSWTDALVAHTPLGDNTIENPLASSGDVFAALIFTALGVLWLVSTGQVVGAKAEATDEQAAAPKAKRQHSDLLARVRAEAAFATSALSFFVGWSWVVVLRAGTALVVVAVNFLFVTLARLLNGALDEHDPSYSDFLWFVLQGSSVISVILLGPGLTVVLL